MNESNKAKLDSDLHLSPYSLIYRSVIHVWYLALKSSFLDTHPCSRALQ